MANIKDISNKEEVGEEKPQDRGNSPFPDKVLERVLAFVQSHRDRNSFSIVCKDWYAADRVSRKHVFIGNCYSVSPEMVARRFPNIRSVTLKGKPRFSDFNLVPPNWGADLHQWLLIFASAYPSLEELKLKRMTVTDESLYFLAQNFPEFKVLSLVSCDGFSTNGLASIATYCRNLTEFKIEESGIDDLDGNWLSCFPESFTTLEKLDFSNLQSEVNFDDLERLVARCKSLRVLKVNKHVALDQLRKLLILAPQITELGTGSFAHEHNLLSYAELESAFGNCKNLHTLSGLWTVSSLYLPTLYPACSNLTFLNFSYTPLQSTDLEDFLSNCTLLRRLWVLDTVGDKGLEAVASSCPLLEELRVFPTDPSDHEDMIEGGEDGVTEAGFVAISQGCPNLHYVLYFCSRMTNDAMETIVCNCPNFTHFRLCIMAMCEPDHLTGEPMDEGFGAVVKTCTKLQRLSVSGLLTDKAFEHIGAYAKNLESLSVAFAGSSDKAMQCVMKGCTKLRKLEIRDCPFGDSALLSGMERYESMRSLWMSGCEVTVNGCRLLAKKMQTLNVEVIKDDADEHKAEKVYVYRSVAGPRSDAPPFVLTM